MIIPKPTYYKVAAALFALMFLTVAMAYVDLGRYNIMIALTIAIVKAVLVIMYFMHVKYNTKLVWIFASAGFVWLLIMFVITMSDYLTRS